MLHSTYMQSLTSDKNEIFGSRIYIAPWMKVKAEMKSYQINRNITDIKSKVLFSNPILIYMHVYQKAQNLQIQD